MSIQIPGENTRMLKQQLGDILKLPPVPMAWALVGMYLGFFATLENAIDQTLVNVVGMGSVPFMALNRNLDLRAKVNVLLTLSDMVYAVPRGPVVDVKELQERGKKTSAALNELIRPHIEERNMVAHSIFNYASPNDRYGVVFRVVKATNKLKITSTFWDIEHFLQRVADFERLELALSRFAEDAERYGFHKLSRARNIAELYTP